MRSKRVLSLLLCALLAATLCACGKSDEIKIAVIVKSVDSDFWHNFKSGVESAATEYNVSVTFEGPENEEDYAAQNEMISRAAKRGVDVIVLSAIDRTQNVSAVEAAVRGGTRVIAADSALDSQLVSLFIGTDNPEAGRAAAKAVADGFADGEKICLGIVGCTEKTENILQREAGIRAYFDTLENAEITAVVGADSNIKSAREKAEELMRDYPQINALVALNEWTTLGMGEAVKALGAEDSVRAVGFDTNTVSVGMLETGEMSALIVQNPFAMGYLSVKCAAELVAGTRADEKTLYTAVTIVNRENMYDPDIQKILFSFQ